jgi:hypothetical protein
MPELGSAKVTKPRHRLAIGFVRALFENGALDRVASSDHWLLFSGHSPPPVLVVGGEIGFVRALFREPRSRPLCIHSPLATFLRPLPAARSGRGRGNWVCSRTF